MSSMIRKANIADLDAINEIYERVHDGIEKGIITNGWKRNIYPTRKTAQDAISGSEMFVFEKDGKICACGRINGIQDEVYKEINWENNVPDDKITVLHTLAVLPEESGKGIGTQFVKYYEEYAKAHQRPYLRMDTNRINLRARELYKRLGYTEAGIVHCNFNGLDGVDLVCLEKCVK